MLLTLGTAQANTLTSGLVAYWPFDSNTKDVSGHGHNLSKNRGNISWAPDRLGKDASAASFNGATDLSGHVAQYTANSMMLSIWCKPSANVPTSQGESLAYTFGQNMPNTQYVIFPAHGGANTTGKAGVGLLVGQNGVIVIEHAEDYL